MFIDELNLRNSFSIARFDEFLGIGLGKVVQSTVIVGLKYYHVWIIFVAYFSMSIGTSPNDKIITSKARRQANIF
jgi:hypothetical protein